VKPQLKDFLLYILLLILLMLGAVVVFSKKNTPSQELPAVSEEGTKSAMFKKQYASLPKMEISEEKKYQARPSIHYRPNSYYPENPAQALRL